MRRALLVATLLLAFPAGRLPAQTANLVADSVRIEEDGVLVAEGDVQVFYEGQVLTAPRVAYDRDADRLTVDGPIRLVEGDRSVILADSAALDADLRNGVLRSARLVLDRQLQIAANQIARVDGRYVQLSNTVASSCEICEGGPPTWEIRARRIVHDRRDEVIHFNRATFRFYGLPIAYFPRLTLPDPNRERKTGFLLPRFASNSRLGFGVKEPFFLTLGPHADLTLTPYLSPKTRTIEGRYRQNLSFGALNVQGAVSQDDLTEEQPRWYVFGDAAFLLPLDFRLDLRFENVSDDAYIFDYDYDYQDRLTNEIRLSRVERDRFFRASLADVTTLRGRERAIRDTLPSRVGDLLTELRLPTGSGEVRFDLDAGTIYRESDLDGLGRDVRNFGGSVAYLDRRVSRAGLVVSSVARAEAQVYHTRQDPTFDDSTGWLSATVATEARLPLQKTGPGGGSHLLEPVLQLAWSEQTEATVPNEDSLLVEFDEGNLFALSRFPGNDAMETGFRGTLGVSYTGRFAGGNGVDLTFGRIYRAEPQATFPKGSSSGGAVFGLAGGRPADARIGLRGDRPGARRFDIRDPPVGSAHHLFAAGLLARRIAEPDRGRA